MTSILKEKKSVLFCFKPVCISFVPAEIQDVCEQMLPNVANHYCQSLHRTFKRLNIEFSPIMSVTEMFLI